MAHQLGGQVTSLAYTAEQIAARWLTTVSLEELLTSPLFFGLTTASPLQRALCRIAEGSPLGQLASDPTVVSALAGRTSLPGRPKELAVVAGIRTGKSLLAAALGVHAALRADLSVCGAGEKPRVGIVSTSKDNAHVVFDHLVGRCKASPMLRGLIVGETADSITLQRPDGRRIEVCTVAGSRAGSSLVARWLCAVVFDEYARMLGDTNDGVVNWAESRRAVLERILPGGYLVHISSPWAPFGPAYDHVQKHWGAPSKQLVVVRAKAYEMNPGYWTPERVADAKANDPDVWNTDIEANFLSPEESLYNAELLAGCMRGTSGDLPRLAGATYTARTDPATRGNGWTFAIFTRDGKMRRVVYAHEWVGTRIEPLNPREVLGQMAPICQRYGVTRIDSDMWSGDSLQAIAEDHGLSIDALQTSQSELDEQAVNFRTMLAAGEVDLPNIPQLRVDLLKAQRRVTTTGMRVHLPKTTDGRHCDWVPTIVGGMNRYADDLDRPRAVKPDDEQRRMREALEQKYAPQTDEERYS